MCFVCVYFSRFNTSFSLPFRSCSSLIVVICLFTFFFFCRLCHRTIAVVKVTTIFFFLAVNASSDTAKEGKQPIFVEKTSPNERSETQFGSKV